MKIFNDGYIYQKHTSTHSNVCVLMFVLFPPLIFSALAFADVKAW